MVYARPRAIIAAETATEVAPALAALRRAHAKGAHLAGFLSFEAGYALEPKLAPRLRMPADGLPLLWFGLFDAPAEADPAALFAGEAGLLGWGPRWRAEDHAAAIADVQALIAAGDIYQANLTFPCDVAPVGTPLALYGRLRAAQAAAFGAVVHTGAAWALSLSPELFVSLAGGRLTARPMKGTAARRDDPEADRAAAEALVADPKNRAENLMIVDLLRNDLSRVARAGSVAVPRLFEIESYPTIHQMTSTITAELMPGCGPLDVVERLFPCGSVTGAPKIRAMEVIADVEPAPRGLYSGGIGHIRPGGDADFNVAIRTITIDADGRAAIGLGSGVVADSEAAAEYAECLAKGAFLDRARIDCDLIETMRYEPWEGGIQRIELHMQRLRASARALGFIIDTHTVRDRLNMAVMPEPAPRRVRLVLARSGEVSVQVAPVPAASEGPVAVRVVPLPVPVSDARLRHKTTDRAFYDEARAASGAFEVVFARPDGRLTEGSFTSLFVPRDGKLLTPPLADGLLPGVLRADLITRGEAVEAPLTAADLSEDFFIGNSLRGLLRARLA
ncbi:MAG: aminodeoxychorismate synthase component I [Alphaproteobacteria bacterium]|nr:aminodeoxychorismate synthase component I [Alphaproteobacteria bacterium]